MNMPLLNVTGVSKSFDGFRALDAVSLEVPQHTIVGLIGPNGCGKSTLFNCISGFINPEQGRVSLKGQDITGMEPHRIAQRGLVRTFQNGHATARMTVLENMLMANNARIRETPWSALFARRAIARQQRDQLQRARNILDDLKLTEVANEYAGNLSGGQQKLLALARAIMCDAELIMLDEPAAGVNPSLVRDFVEMLRRLRDEHGKTFLVIEHDMKFIAGVCDTVSVLSAGQNLASGSPHEMQRDPRVLEVYLGKHQNDVA